MEELVQTVDLAVCHQEETMKMKEISQRITSYNMEDFPRGWDEVKFYNLLLLISIYSMFYACLVSSTIHAVRSDSTHGGRKPYAPSKIVAGRNVAIQRFF